MRVYRSRRDNIVIQHDNGSVEFSPLMIPVLVQSLQQEWMSTHRTRQVVRQEIETFQTMQRANRALHKG
jgi:hypothetical protein